MKTFPNKILTKSQAEQALDTAVALVRQNLPLYTDHCQNHSSVHDIYPQCENNQWTCGFWPGEVWLSYERTGDAAFKNTALTLVDSFLYRIENKIEVDHHDMGFLYSPSCVAAYKLTGSEKGRRAAILAADQLCTRFQEKGSFFQAWGPLGAKDNYRYIIDCLLNVPLLYWASETTGDAHYAELAHRHVTTCLANSIRPDLLGRGIVQGFQPLGGIGLLRFLHRQHDRHPSLIAPAERHQYHAAQPNGVLLVWHDCVGIQFIEVERRVAHGDSDRFWHSASSGFGFSVRGPPAGR